jgi:hypothetical protein
MRCENLQEVGGPGRPVAPVIIKQLHEARALLPGLPTSRRQNYMIHEAFDKAIRLVQTIEMMACNALPPANAVVKGRTCDELSLFGM